MLVRHRASDHDIVDLAFYIVCAGMATAADAADNTVAFADAQLPRLKAARSSPVLLSGLWHTGLARSELHVHDQHAGKYSRKAAEENRIKGGRGVGTERQRGREASQSAADDTARGAFTEACDGCPSPDTRERDIAGVARPLGSVDETLSLAGSSKTRRSHIRVAELRRLSADWCDIRRGVPT
ncbi:hypothetical protein F503_02982 [Ophiostoma piceae UAMH 11346]|uniref:Uncharacterized protein n=1 Tax=Ophiostoma piceae (strain UAMH 11346) TaxID=1262450 RepID=S3CIF6_OPHP1|nr:hypothetical protein F503_02982 [Ophiostoma piceae UAMH 11346]